MLVLTPPDADPLLLTGANDAQLFAYSIRHFQTVSLSHLLGHFVISLVISLVTFEFHCYFLSQVCGTWSPLYLVHQCCSCMSDACDPLYTHTFAKFDSFERDHSELPLVKFAMYIANVPLAGCAHSQQCAHSSVYNCIMGLFLKVV